MKNGQRTRQITDYGIVLAVQNVGEADKILTIFTRNFGKLEILGKNVKKLNSKRSSACNILTFGKFAISKSKFDTLAEVVNLNQFPKIKSNLQKLALAYLAIEFLNQIVPLDIASVRIFENLLNFLRELEKTSSLRDAKVKLATFQVRLFIETGWLGRDFKISNFPNFASLEKFLVSKFEGVSQKKLQSTEFAKYVGLG